MAGKHSEKRTGRTAAKKRKLPPALAKRAAAAAALKKQELRQIGLDAIASIRQRKVEIASAFYEIGVALVTLDAPLVVRALSRKSFDDVLAKDLGMSASSADRLKAIAQHVHEADALAWGQDKSAAVADLVATLGLMKAPPGRLMLPSGKRVDLGKASPEELKSLAKAVRQTRQKEGATKRPRGRTTTPEERREAEQLAKELKKQGLRATVECLATKPGAPADVRIRVPLARIRELARAIDSHLRS